MLSHIQGRWVTDEDDSDVEITIEIKDGTPNVKARCISDGEELVVTELKWVRQALSFETFVPSNGFRARHVMRFKSLDQCEHELTLFETWKRLPRKKP